MSILEGSGARRTASGFSLIELVVGITVTGVALAMLSSLIFPLFARSVEPMFQIRAAEVAQSILDEMQGRRYDENTPVGGFPPCAPLAPAPSGPCTDELSFGTGADAGEIFADRGTFDDVDDYDDFCGAAVPYQDIFGAAQPNYNNYSVTVCVTYDGDYNGATDTNQGAKLITISVFHPLATTINEAIIFSVYRGNY